MAAKKKEDAKTRKMAVTEKKEEEDVSGRKCLEVLGSADPKQWLAAPPELVKCVRAASEYLFSVLGTHTESELRQLLTQNFDPEQIWQQIDLQATPALDKIKASLRTLESSPRLELFRLKDKPRDSVRSQAVEENGDSEEDEDELLDAGEVSGSDDEEEEDEVDEDGEQDDELEEEYSDYDEEEKKAVEDKFLKLSDMEKFLDRADAEEAGIVEDDDDDDGEEDDDEGDDDDDLELDEAFDFSARAADRENGDSGWGPKYSDFIGKGKKKETKLLKKKDSDDEFEEDDLGEGDEDEEDDDDEELGTMDIEPVEEKKLSAHERQQEKTKRRIEQLEKANLESKDWTMQGEVSASRRSKNSALEVELDFEHGARPAPVITEEVTQSLEDMIRSRIIEGNFDDPQPRAAPVTAVPKERIEMDEEKSKKGLGEIYEQQYMESTGLAVAATPATETLKAEATILFKNLCYKLDALSHFHFAPKPAQVAFAFGLGRLHSQHLPSQLEMSVVVEEMEVKVDVPALAMEEVAPIAVSDASMLAPEEVFKSAGLIKGESELTPEERKRRRAQKKRKRKGAKNAAENLKKLRPNNVPASDLPKELNVRSKYTDKRTTSSFSKSAKVFGELDKAQERGNKAAKPDNSGVPTLHASSLKL